MVDIDNHYLHRILYMDLKDEISPMVLHLHYRSNIQHSMKKYSLSRCLLSVYYVVVTLLSAYSKAMSCVIESTYARTRKNSNCGSVFANSFVCLFVCFVKLLYLSGA